MKKKEKNKKKILIIIICVLSVIALIILGWLIYHLSSNKKEEKTVENSLKPSDYSFWLETPQDYLTDKDKNVVDDDSDTELVIDFNIERSKQQ